MASLVTQLANTLFSPAASGRSRSSKPSKPGRNRKTKTTIPTSSEPIPEPTSTTPDLRNSVLLFVGPGGKVNKHFTKDVDTCTSTLRSHKDMRGRYTIKGNGVDDLTEEMILEGFTEHASKWGGENITVIVSSHAKNLEGEHSLRLSRQARTQTKSFVTDDIVGKFIPLLRKRGIAPIDSPTDLPKIDLVLASCNSGIALSCAEELPFGSRLLAASDSTACSRYLSQIFDRLHAGNAKIAHTDFSARSILNTQFMTAVTACQRCCGSTPSYAISTSDSVEKSYEAHHPQDDLTRRYGRPFTSEELTEARRKWGGWVNNDKKIGDAKIKDLMDRIGSARVVQAGSSEYQLAMAICDRLP